MYIVKNFCIVREHSSTQNILSLRIAPDHTACYDAATFRKDGTAALPLENPGMAKNNGTKVSQRLLQQLHKLACTSILDALGHLGYEQVFMQGVRTLVPGRRRDSEEGGAHA